MENHLILCFLNTLEPKLCVIPRLVNIFKISCGLDVKEVGVKF